MSAFLSGLGVVINLELRQRVRGTASYVLLGLFFVLVAIVTFLVWLALTGFGSQATENAGIFSTVIYFVLLLGTLVTPALSGNAVNGDRDAGTLATTQVTLLTTWQIILGKFVASWITALAFLAVAVPFLLFSMIVGDIRPDTIAVSILVLAIELGVVAAIGVGLSAIISKPLFSVVATYLVVAALSIGTLIAFGLGGLATQSEQRSTYINVVWPTDGSNPDTDAQCEPPQVSTYNIPRFDYYWWILSANPYVVLADASPTSFDRYDNPEDLFGFIKLGVRSAQISPDLDVTYNDCERWQNGTIDEYNYNNGTTGRETIESTVPSWFVGFGIHVLLGVGALAWGWSRTNTPARKLAKGSRIA
jgi:ABC-type transport system involved in multi-copper enzyme maturation permease subunit